MLPQTHSILPLPISEELIQYLPISQAIAFFSSLLSVDHAKSLLSENIKRLSLYDLRFLKSTKHSVFKELINTEIRRRLNTNIYDELIDYLQPFYYDRYIINYSKDLDLVYKLYRDPNYFSHLSKNPNITMEFLEKHPRLIRYEMASNKVISQEYFANNIEQFGQDAYKYFSLNPNLTKEFFNEHYKSFLRFLISYKIKFVDYDFIRDHWDYLLHIQFIPMDKKSRKWIARFLQIDEQSKELLEMDYTFIKLCISNNNISLEQLDKLIDEKHLNRKMTYKLYFKNPHAPLDFITDYLNEYNNPYNVGSASSNKSINMDFILNKILPRIESLTEFPRYITLKNLTINMGITIDNILEHPEVPWNKEYINSRLDVTEAILEDPNYPYKENRLSNRNISSEFIIRNNLLFHQGETNNIIKARDELYENGFTQDPEYVELAHSILNMD